MMSNCLIFFKTRIQHYYWRYLSITRIISNIKYPKFSKLAFDWSLWFRLWVLCCIFIFVFAVGLLELSQRIDSDPGLVHSLGSSRQGLNNLDPVVLFQFGQIKEVLFDIDYLVVDHVPETLQVRRLDQLVLQLFAQELGVGVFTLVD